MSDIFAIKAMAASWQGLNYSVTWNGRGVVAKQQQLSKLWKAAFDSCKKGFRVGFSFDSGEAIRVDTAVAHSDQYSSIDYLVHLVAKHGGIVGVGFEYREEAEQFVDTLSLIHI